MYIRELLYDSFNKLYTEILYYIASLVYNCVECNQNCRSMSHALDSCTIVAICFYGFKISIFKTIYIKYVQDIFH